MGKKTRIVLPSSDHVVTIAPDVSDPRYELVFLIDVEVGLGCFRLEVVSEVEFIRIYNRLEQLKDMGIVHGELGGEDIDSEWLIDDWPTDDDGDYYNYPSFKCFWVDADNVFHDANVEHIGEVHAEEEEPA